MSLKITPSTSQQDDPTPQPEKIHCYTKLVVRYPIPFSLFCFFSTILVAYLSTTVGIDLGLSWMDFNTIIVKNNWAMTNLYASADKLPTSSTTKDVDIMDDEAYYADICAVEKLQTRGINGNGNRYMMFRSKTRNILTQENIDSIQKAISSVIAVPGYDKFCLRSDNNWSGCLSPKSFLQIESFSDSTANSTCGCTDTPPWYVTKISKENNFCYNSENIITSTPSLDSLQRPLKNLCTVTKNGTGNIMCDMWSKNIREQAFPLLWNCDDLQTEFVQVNFDYGYDFDKAMCAEAVSKSTGIKGDVGYMDNMTFVHQSEDERIYPFIHSMDSQFAKIKQDIEKENMDLEVLYSGYIDVFAVLQNDLLYMFISISFVFIILLVQTESLCITLAGLFEIIMSIPLALFVWCVLFQMEGVSSLMFVGFFVIIGIGADDIFVFVDAFKQSAYEPPHISGNLETRFQWAYKRSVTAMLATSVTTCCAFGVAGLLPMWDFQNLAVFNASMVIFDFILVITWLPCAVIISHKYLTPIWEIIKQRFGCGTKTEKNDQQTQIKPRCMERCFGGIFADCILQSKWILSMVFLILLSTTVLVSIIFVQLDGEALKFFRPDHIETRTMEYRKKFSTPNNDYRIVTAVVGPDSMNSWDIKDARPYLVVTESNNKNTFVNGGNINVYSSFDLAKSQEEFIDLCTNMQIEMKTMDLTYAVEEYCFMKEFKEWSLWQGYGFPVKEDQFPTLLLDWRKDSGGYMNATIMSSQKNTDEFWWYGLCTGFALDDVLKPTKVIAAWASFNLTQKINVEYPLEEDMALQLKVENILTSVLDDIASPTMNINSAFVHSSFFLFSWLKNTLFKFALESIIIAICCATVIIVLMTANWWIALICFFTLCCILSTALNLMIIAGWKIGLNEACCLVVAAGVSVDYVLHMAHSYNHQSGSKEERTRAALREMGISVTSGFITTVSSSFALVLCDFAIFLRLGQFLTMTLTSSWFITMFLMMSVLASVGPNEGQGDIPFLVDLVKDKSHAVGNLSVIKETNENNNTVEMTYLKKDSGSDGSDGDTVDVGDTRSKQTEKESDTEET